MELDDRNELPTTDHVGLETPCNNAHDPTKLCRKSGEITEYANVWVFTEYAYDCL